LAEAIGAREHRQRSASRLQIDPALTPLGNATIDELGSRMRKLSLKADQNRSDFFAAIVRFDELEGWRVSGASGCVRWMIDSLGLGRSRAYEQYKCATDLHALPAIAAAFAAGKLNWCKVRALLAVATPQDEQALLIAALDLTPDQVKRMCIDYRFGKDPGSDAERDREQHERRSLTWKLQADGSVTMQIVLPPESGADVVRCLQHREELLFADVDGSSTQPRPTSQQRRADALVAMAHASVSGQNRGNDATPAKADRQLVITHTEIDALNAAEHRLAGEPSGSDAPLAPPLRAAIAGVLGGSISPATARRLACEGSLVTMILEKGEPIAVGRRLRLHTTAQRRAILTRDGGCTFPGCGATRHLDVHHTTLWRDGGETSVRDGVTLCSACHRRVHDEGWRISRVPDETPVVRSPDAQARLDGADERSRAIVRRLDTQRSAFRFDGPHTNNAAPPCCDEQRGAYRLARHRRPRRSDSNRTPTDGSAAPHREATRPMAC